MHQIPKVTLSENILIKFVVIISIIFLERNNISSSRTHRIINSDVHYFIMQLNLKNVTNTKINVNGASKYAH